MKAYYNENHKPTAAWLRELIKRGLIADGDVDDRSIEDVRASDLAGYVQCHFFAGIAGWSLALRLAGWPDDRPVWTGSCPCQPFSTAGKRKGVADERHLWPAFARLIAECRPAQVFGEQVSAAIRLGWVDGVRADLAREGYALGFAVLGAHSVGAPHIRQRIYWLANAAGLHRAERVGESRGGARRDQATDHATERGNDCRLADTEHPDAGPRIAGVEGQARSGRHRPSIDGAVDRLGDSDAGRLAQGETVSRCAATGAGVSMSSDRLEHPAGDGRHERRAEPGGRGTAGGCGDGGVDKPVSAGPQGLAGHGDNGREPGRLGTIEAGSVAEAGAACGVGDADERNASAEREQRGGQQRFQPHGHWSDSTAIACLDGKSRRVGRGVRPLADGIPRDMGRGQPELFRLARRARANRTGRLRGYGNAIVPELAAEFVRACMEVIA